MLKKFYGIMMLSLSIFSLVFSSSSNSYNEDHFLKPTDTDIVTCRFGNRYLFEISNFHNGIDYGAFQNSYVYATKSGVVTNASFLTGYGICVTILHQDGYKSLYSHLSEDILVRNGDHVNQGDVIGKVGPKILSNGTQNGWTTGPHLHFSVFNDKGIAINPEELDIRKK